LLYQIIFHNFKLTKFFKFSFGRKAITDCGVDMKGL